MQRQVWPGRVAIALTALSVLCVAGGVWIEIAAAQAGREVNRSASSDLVVAVLFPVIGALVLHRDPRNRTGWVLVSCALVGVSVLAHQWAYDAEVTRPGVLPWGELFVWLAAWTYWPYWLQPTLLPVLFPRGEVPPGRWRLYLRAVLTVAALGIVGTMLKVDDDVEGLGLDNPLGLPGIGKAALVLQPGSVALLGLVATPIALVGLFRRTRRATGVEHAQLQWLTLGFATCFGIGVLSSFVRAVDDLLFSLAFAAIPVSIAIAIVRHGLFDIDVVVNRTVVYATLTGLSVLAYVGLVAAVNHYTDGNGAGPVIAALVVAAAASARTKLQQLVDRRLFGARRDPMSLVEQLGTTDDLPSLADTVRAALRLPFVQVLDDDGEALATSGEPVAGTHVVDVVDRGRHVGVLVVGRRSRNERLRPEDEAALQEVARRTGALLREAALSEDLQQAYEQTVLAREEERKRLRRDLHDGVGPALAGMALQLDSLAGRLTEDPALAARAEGLRDRLRGTVGEVRRIVDGLRPAALDELGLAAALEALATDDAAITVMVRTAVPEDLPAAVEVAAYRIASEAVANALRHSGAQHVTLTVSSADGALAVTVTDDGRGFGADATAGVGLQSLHDRAAEVGGTLTVTSTAEGTTVRAELPL